MSRTELIERELLRALDNGTGIDEVLERHRDSKSVLYAALAGALPVAEQRLSAAQRAETAVERSVRNLQNKEEGLTNRIAELQSEIAALEQRDVQVTDCLAGRQALLDRINALEEAGFSTENLETLSNSLATLAKANQLSPTEAVDVFFATVDRCSELTSLEAERWGARKRTKKAKAEVRRREAEARRAEKASRIRLKTIEVVRRMGHKELERTSSCGGPKCWMQLISH